MLTQSSYKCILDNRNNKIHLSSTVRFNPNEELGCSSFGVVMEITLKYKGPQTQTIMVAQSPNRPPLSAIQEHLSSFLLAFPSGLLGAMQDTQLGAMQDTQFASKPAGEHMPRPTTNHPVPNRQAPTSPFRHTASQSSSCPSSSCSCSKRVSWADEYYTQDPRPRTQAQRMVDREHPLSVRLQGFAAAERTALGHVDRARQVTASNTLHANSHHDPRTLFF